MADTQPGRFHPDNLKEVGIPAPFVKPGMQRLIRSIGSNLQIPENQKDTSNEPS